MSLWACDAVGIIAIFVIAIAIVITIYHAICNVIVIVTVLINATILFDPRQ